MILIHHARPALARAAILAAAMSVAATGHAGAADLATFRVGEASPANTFLAIWMAQDASFYEKNGLKVEIVHMVGGSDSGPALKDGRIQLMHIGLSSVVRANLNGLGDLRSIGSLSNTIRNTFFLAPGKTVKDLKGGTVGISSVGSESDSSATLALRRLGLDRKDVTIKEVGTDRLTPLKAGQITGTVLGEPQRTEAFGLKLTSVVDLYGEKIPWLYSGLTVDNAYMTANRDTLTRFMKATVEGNWLAVSDAERAKKVLARELKITDPKVLQASYDNFKAETPPNAEIDIQGAKNVIDVVVPANKSHKIGDYIDTGIMDGLKTSGFFDEMKKKYAAAR
ncbi:MAG TPA: ABC transporter substrate-binding protein [Alphaproteobacteria bacterium]|jgi:NitT/TauT family transport system substrate-binding protein|nr:ABC transporter substrate-binding protein [Alphaproteobacteria bacterium]